MNHQGIGTIVVAGLLLSFAGMAAEKLNVKTGLWEVTSETQMSGMPPLPRELLDRLSPEQRAAMEAAIKAQSDKAPIRDTTQECVTEKDLEEPFKTDDIEGCERTMVTNTPTRQEIRLTCTGTRKGSGLFLIDTPTPETMTGAFEMKVESGSDTMVITTRLKGKWLGAACGDKAGKDD